ncbi:MAG: FtsX-like permease family protein, partial [Verrucomicrobiales bacterium]
MKSFSWTLALRYLNPLRTFVSVITLISLMGVAFGVMVLIVVLSVHAGFERNLKEILLGSSPHVQIRPNGAYAGLENWQVMEKELAAEPKVTGAYAFIEGYVLMDSKNWQQPVSFRAVNTEDEAEIASLDDLLDRENFPESRTDMGLDDYVVVSKQLAEAMRVQVGEKIRVIAAKNLEGLMEVMSLREQERAYQAYPESIQAFESRIGELIEVGGGRESGPVEGLDEAYRLLQALLPGPNGEEGKAMRFGEKRLVDSILARLNDFEKKEGRYHFPDGTLEGIRTDLKALKEIDLQQEDAEALGNLDQFVLPKELTVWGVYHDVRRATGPSLFVPLNVGQELKGLQGTVEAVGLRVEDPYHVRETTDYLRGKLGEEWFVSDWMEQHQAQFQLVKTERLMTSFALSFIMILSAFSIMAVMYTVTVQKRQEIGVMKALGARPSQVVRVFVYQGLIVGVFGALFGVALGLLVIHFRSQIQVGMRAFGFDPFPADFQGMSEIPALINPGVITLVSFV